MSLNLDNYIADSIDQRPGWWLYAFPNGRKASVVPDPRPGAHLRFEVQVDGEQPTPGLTTEQVESRLAEIAGQAQAE